MQPAYALSHRASCALFHILLFASQNELLRNGTALFAIQGVVLERAAYLFGYGIWDDTPPVRWSAGRLAIHLMANGRTIPLLLCVRICPQQQSLPKVQRFSQSGIIVYMNYYQQTVLSIVSETK